MSISSTIAHDVAVWSPHQASRCRAAISGPVRPWERCSLIDREGATKDAPPYLGPRVVVHYPAQEKLTSLVKGCVYP